MNHHIFITQESFKLMKTCSIFKNMTFKIQKFIDLLTALQRYYLYKYEPKYTCDIVYNLLIALYFSITLYSNSISRYILTLYNSYVCFILNSGIFYSIAFET